MKNFYDVVKERRSIYTITDESVISDDKIIEITENALLHTPSPFNSQSTRVAVLFGKAHKTFWNTVAHKLREIVPADKFSETEKRINSFSAGYGTILYFEDTEVVKDLQNRFPSYKDNFPVWSEQTNAIMQYLVWLSFTAEGMGASLQHYNPIVDDKLYAEFSIPHHWKLIAQMPFGKSTAPALPKDSLPIKDRVLVFK